MLMPYKTFTELSEKPKRMLANSESNRVSDHSLQAKPHPVPQMQRSLGNRNIAQLIQAKRLTPEGKIINLQRKLTVGAADDQYEQEADRVARQVINTSDAAVAANSMQRTVSPEEDKDKMLQTKPLAVSISPFVQREMVNTEEPEDKEKPVQAKFLTEISRESLQRQPEAEEEEPIQAKPAGASSGSFEAGADVETQVSQSKGHGSPLPDPVRAYMEPRFGVDFGHVRVHTSSDALQMNQSVGAQAFTHGSDIYYGEGRSPTNLELTAHELTHVIQQTGSSSLQLKGKSEESWPSGSKTLMQRKCPNCALEDTEKKKMGINGISKKSIQRTIGDGHDLSSPRFAGDPILEACFDNERVLRTGDSGGAVATLQHALIEAGAFPTPPRFGADGVFGEETETAVRNFQRAQGLTGSDVDGVVGPTTMGLLDTRFPGATAPGTAPIPGIPAPSGSAPILTPVITTPPTPTTCGGMNFVVQWNLSGNAGRLGGFIIQDVTFIWSVVDCTDTPVPNPDARTSPLHYFEAWRVAPNSTNLSPVSTDTFFWPNANPWGGPETKGFVAIIATAQFHNNVLDLANHMTAFNGDTFAGSLRSSLADPNTGGDVSPVVPHNLFFHWDCCPAGTVAATVLDGNTP